MRTANGTKTKRVNPRLFLEFFPEHGEAAHHAYERLNTNADIYGGVCEAQKSVDRDPNAAEVSSERRTCGNIAGGGNEIFRGYSRAACRPIDLYPGTCPTAAAI